MTAMEQPDLTGDVTDRLLIVAAVLPVGRPEAGEGVTHLRRRPRLCLRVVWLRNRNQADATSLAVPSVVSHPTEGAEFRSVSEPASSEYAKHLVAHLSQLALLLD